MTDKTEKVKMVWVKERIYDDPMEEEKLVDAIGFLESLMAKAIENGAKEEDVLLCSDVEVGYDGFETAYFLLYSRPETEKERESREKRGARQRERSKAQREKQKADAEKRERKELDRLLKKYKEDTKSE